MDKFGLKVTGVDELETILPRRCDVIRPQAKRRVEHALHFINNASSIMITWGKMIW